ncbi:MAG: LURP-one-related family protein [Promethearchaeota archaeon]
MFVVGEFRTLFCWNCGARVYPGQRFCEKCGEQLAGSDDGVGVQPQVTDYPASTANTGGSTGIPRPEAVESSSVNWDDGEWGSGTWGSPGGAPTGAAGAAGLDAGGLFDQSREFYVLHEKFWDWGSGDILDQRGNLVGLMRRKWFSLRGLIELQEVDGTTRCAIHRKILAIRQTFDLKDGEENLLGRFKRALLAVFRPKIYMEDASGVQVLEARGNFMRWDFEIRDAGTGRVVAQIHKLDRWRDVFLGGIFDFSDQYAVHVTDPGVDRRLVLGFAIAIDNSMHDSRTHGVGLHNAGRLGRHGGRWPGGWRGF